MDKTAETQEGINFAVLLFITVTFMAYMGRAKAKVLAGETEHLCKLYA